MAKPTEEMTQDEQRARYGHTFEDINWVLRSNRDHLCTMADHLAEPTQSYGFAVTSVHRAGFGDLVDMVNKTFSDLSAEKRMEAMLANPTKLVKAYGMYIKGVEYLMVKEGDDSLETCLDDMKSVFSEFYAGIGKIVTYYELYAKARGKAFKQRGVKPLLADLIQEARMGLIDAAIKFNPNYGVKFLTYARLYVEQRIQHISHKESQRVSASVGVYADLVSIERYRSHVLRHEGIDLTPEELAERTEKPLSRINNALGVAGLREASLDRQIYGDGGSTTYGDRVGDMTKEEREIDYAKLIDGKRFREKIYTPGWADLTETESRVIKLMFFEGQLNQKEISVELGMSKTGVRLYEGTAYRKIKRTLKYDTHVRNKGHYTGPIRTF